MALISTLKKGISTAQNHLKQTYSWSEFHAEHDAIKIKFSSKTCHQVAWFQYLEKPLLLLRNMQSRLYSWSEFNAEHEAIIIKFSSKTCHQVALISILRKRHFYCSEPFETNIFLIRISSWAWCDHNKIKFQNLSLDGADFNT